MGVEYVLGGVQDDAAHSKAKFLYILNVNKTD